MEKRILPFIILSMVVLLGFQALNSWLNPPPPVGAEAKGDLEGVAEAIEADRNQAESRAEESTTDESTTSSEVASEIESEEQMEPAVTEPPVAAERSAVDPQWLTLGSLDPESPYQMLVWLNNRGASIECVALNSPRFSDLDDKFGYLGYLALTDEDEGCRINAVGAGTPAAAAKPQSAQVPPGLQAGDYLVRLNEATIRSAPDVRLALERTKPGQSVEVVVRRIMPEGPVELGYTVELVKRPLEVIRPEPMIPSAGEPQHPLSYLMTLAQVGNRGLKRGDQEIAGLPSLYDSHWNVNVIERPDGPLVEFEFDLRPEDLASLNIQGHLRVIKRYHLAQIPADEPRDVPHRGYHLNYEIEIRNLGNDPVDVAYQLDGPTGLPLEGWWYTYKTHPTKWGGAGVRDVVCKSFGGKHRMFSNPQIVERIEDNPENPMLPMFEDEQPRVQYVGVDAQYFNSALVADVEQETDASTTAYLFEEAFARTVAPIDPLRSSRTDVSFRLISPVVEIPAGGQHSQKFLIFAGPKQPNVLAPYNLGECITYGWFPWVAKPLQWVLHSFYFVVRNYGIAIILLTVLVRGLMTPLGLHQARNAQKMQELAPEMKKIAEQYKNDMEKRAAAQRELFRKHNYNPLSGCLPMFIQLPIFIGLYRALSVDIELRQASLIPGLQWCSNLAGPDKLLYWENFMPAFLASPVGWLGPYLNILPLISVAFMMVHQKMFTPPPTDEQQQMQQSMMKFMMLFFGFMFFKVPAGLCLYFITSSAWGLAERMLLPKSKGKDSGKAGEGAAAAAARVAERKRLKPQKKR